MEEKGWRTVVINNPENISLEDGNIVVEKDCNISVPINQLQNIIVSTPKGNLSLPAINALIDNNSNIILCDSKYNPSCQIVSFGNHNNLSGNIIDQSNWNQFFKKAVWKEIVEQKIKMQIKLLSELRININPKLYEYHNSVEIDDSDNREGQAARIYFQSLFGKGFRRHSSDNINSALNYAYTIILSAVNKIVVSYGYHTALGIKHCNKSNPFNLSCDIMEPFRPFADKLVFENKDRELDWEYKKLLIEILHTPISYNGKCFKLENAIETYSLDIFKKMKNPKHKIGEINFYG